MNPRRFVAAFLLSVLLSLTLLSCQHGMDQVKPSPRDFLDKAVVGPQGDGTYVVATTQVIDPAGETVLVSGRPSDLAVSPDQKLLVVKTLGRKGECELAFVSLESRRVVQELEMPKSDANFGGVAWDSDGTRVWATDASGKLCAASRQADGTLAWSDEVSLPGPGGRGESAPGGIAIDDARRCLYVALSENNTIAVVSPAEKKVVAEVEVGMAPYTVLICGDKAYVTNWAGRRPVKGEKTGLSGRSQVLVDPKTGVASSGTVSVVDLNSRKTVCEIEVGLHPSGMALSPDKSRLYVANANSDTVSVIDTASDRVVHTFSAKPVKEIPFGSAPNALAVSPDGNTLYVANGGNNLIAVLDAHKGKVRGTIPTGWYPSAILPVQNGSLLCVANLKGIGSRRKEVETSSRPSPEPGKPIGHSSYDQMGSLSLVPTPDQAQLESHTLKAAANMRLPLMESILDRPRGQRKIVPVPSRPGEKSVFKYVLYIIKENRTYDQVFGDMPQGNGEPSLCMFGREVTPNHHALAEEFVLLDNFYCNGVLSADGHQWTNEGYVVDYIEKSFGGWPRSYPYDGDDALAYASSGFIWDHVLRKGLTFRNYGEFVKARIQPGGAKWADVYKDHIEGTKNITIRAEAALHTLEPYICPTFIGFPGIVQDVYRANEFLKEYAEFEKKGECPNFIIMLLPNDHTNGTREGFPTPRAMVADNDLALGRIVEAVSKSRFWPETAIFVVEDDPQAGLDHVDGHRTVALCISPYTKRGEVVSTHYNQCSMLRTMELIFGLAPMNQLTMAANPMLECFTEKPDLTPYTVKPNVIPLDEMNPKVVSLRGRQKADAIASMKLPLDDIDQADETTFNRILWRSVKGYDTPYPKIAGAVTVGPEDEDMD